MALAALGAALAVGAALGKGLGWFGPKPISYLNVAAYVLMGGSVLLFVVRGFL